MPNLWHVAIDGPEQVDPRLFAQICDSLEDLPTLYRADLVDLTTVPERVGVSNRSHVVNTEVEVIAAGLGCTGYQHHNR